MKEKLKKLINDFIEAIVIIIVAAVIFAIWASTSGCESKSKVDTFETGYLFGCLEVIDKVAAEGEKIFTVEHWAWLEKNADCRNMPESLKINLQRERSRQ